MVVWFLFGGYILFMIKVKLQYTLILLTRLELPTKTTRSVIRMQDSLRRSKKRQNGAYSLNKPCILRSGSKVKIEIRKL